jgi:hypothetical protein
MLYKDVSQHHPLKDHREFLAELQREYKQVMDDLGLEFGQLRQLIGMRTPREYLVGVRKKDGTVFACEPQKVEELYKPDDDITVDQLPVYLRLSSGEGDHGWALIGPEVGIRRDKYVQDVNRSTVEVYRPRGRRDRVSVFNEDTMASVGKRGNRRRLDLNRIRGVEDELREKIPAYFDPSLLVMEE